MYTTAECEKEKSTAFAKDF